MNETFTTNYIIKGNLCYAIQESIFEKYPIGAPSIQNMLNWVRTEEQNE